MSDKQTLSTFPAQVLYRATPAELMSQIKADLGDGVEPYIFSAEISSNRLDAYYGRMGESTLLNFAADAQAGVSFQDSHSTMRLGFGQSLTGTFEKTGDIARVVADFYTVPGIEFGGMHSYKSTDDFIRAIKARLARDVSVGFYGGDEICDICGKSVWDWRGDMPCPHIPGLEYPTGDRGQQMTLATFSVEDARLAEVSAVYDGATPEAMILKAERAITDGLLKPSSIRLLETRYRIKLPEKAVTLPVDMKTKGKTMTEQKTDDFLVSVRAALQEFNMAGGTEGDELATIRLIISSKQEALEKVEKLTAEVTRLQPLADDGAKYRADLIADTLAEGVRAMGDNFPQESYSGLLEKADIEAIKKMRDGFKEQARLPKGRQSVDDDQTPVNGKAPQPATPDLAYAG